ncbi:MAG: hypothetical protein WBA02_08180 [Jannaschia helgolandensis]|jgi:hypothetical protein|uniref:SnoaL-like domain-containing protein n=1 Tax=Jannaschia helgolandensis TaxID=188906 RepID=A0A1H7L822_9RHOB|nr:hypothetical protein [Jannaschia helgolandensis]SEK94407.1 hypothetical protein SAMN04488526_1619 [Jannaschia helgolandensis]|tara:strand:+ start:513 stop:935 length:423 start_codon:yes stop_codon:yes gene_type:complete
MKDALTIYQYHLDSVSQLIWDRDFEGVTALMTYPHELATARGVTVVDRPETMVDWAREFRAHLDQLGATSYHRVAVAAAISGEDESEISGFHRVYVLSGATHLIDPYISEATLKLCDGVWLGSGVRAVLRSTRYPVDDEA